MATGDAMTDERLADIQARHDEDGVCAHFAGMSAKIAHEHRGELVAEVRRLRGKSVEQSVAISDLIDDRRDAEDIALRARAELRQVRAERDALRAALGALVELHKKLDSARSAQDLDFAEWSGVWIDIDKAVAAARALLATADAGGER